MGGDCTFEVLSSLCEMPLEWRICGDELAKVAVPLIRGKSLEVLLPLLRAAVKVSTGALVELLGSAVWELLPDAAPQAAAEVLELMATSGLRLDELPAILARVHRLGAPFPAVVAVVAALGERGVEGKDMQACAAFVAEAPHASLEALPPPALLRLMVAATKSAALAETALDVVAAAASVILQAFGMDDTSKLLLAAAKTKGGGEGVSSLFSRAAEVVAPRLRDFSVAQLIKIVLAIGRAPTCRPLLEAAGVEGAGRMPEISQNPVHLVLLVQGLLPLGGSHPILAQILELLTKAFHEASRQENLMGPDLVIDRRKELEAKGQLTADHLAKLAQTLARAIPDNRTFWEALGSRLGEMPKSLTSAGHASLEVAFPAGRGPDFEFKTKMFRVVDAALADKERGVKDVTDMTMRERAIQRQRDYEKREEEHKKRMDKDHRAEEDARQRLRKEMLERTRGKRSRSRSRGKRSRSRSRSRSRGKRSRSRSRSRSRDRREKDRDKRNQRSRSRDRDRDRRR